MIAKIIEMLANADTGLIDAVFSILVPIGLLAALIAFDLLGLGLLTNDLGRANRVIEDMDQPDADMRMRAAEELFEDGDERGRLRPELRDAWSNSLVRNRNDTPPVAIKNIGSAFGENAVIHVAAHRRVAEMVPAYLLVLGLSGISLRLMVVFSRVHITKTLTLGTVLGDAIPAMSAMLLLTLFSILVWYFVDRTVYHIAQHRLAKLQTLLPARLPVLDEADLLHILLEDQKAVAKSMGIMSNEMPTRFKQILLEDFAPSMFDTYRSTIVDHLTPAIRSVVRTVEYFSELSIKSQEDGMRLLADRFYKRLETLFIENLRDFGEQTKVLYSMQERSSRMLESLQSNIHAASLLQQNVNQETISTTHALEETRSRLSESTRLFDESLVKTGEVAAILARALDGDRQMVERLREEQISMQEANNGYLAAMGVQTQQLKDALQTLSVGYTETMGEQTQKINDALQALGGNYMDTMNKQILQMQDDLHSAIQSIFSRFTDINSTTFDSIESQSTNLLEQLATSSKTIMEEMGDQVTDLGFFTREINSEVTALNDALRLTVSQFGDHMRTTMESTFESFDGGVANLVERLSYTAEIIRDSVEDLPAAVVALRGSLIQTAEGQAQAPSPAQRQDQGHDSGHV